MIGFRLYGLGFRVWSHQGMSRSSPLMLVGRLSTRVGGVLSGSAVTSRACITRLQRGQWPFLPSSHATAALNVEVASQCQLDP